MLSELTYPFKYNWFVYGDIAVIGWVFDSKGSHCKEEKLTALFESIVTEADFETVLKNINGNFSVVIDKVNFKATAVDHIRSFPITYRLSKENFELLNNYQNIPAHQINEAAVIAFKTCWCSLGNDTLIKDVFQLQAGQYLWCKKGSKANPKFYYHHFESLKVGENLSSMDKAATLFQSVFKDYLPQLKDKTALVPLSGGYDSRLIISGLHKLGHKNIVAYTYGKKDSHEVEIAKKVAKQLEIEWHFVEYNKVLFEEFFKEDWNSYSSKNHFLTSLPHEQDFFALKALKDRNVLPENFVALPGYCGDLLGGSITSMQTKDYSVNGLKALIKQKHFHGNSIVDSFSYPNKINNKEEFYDAYQHWFAINKVSKFIVNSVRLYEHFGGEWLMPLWDKRLTKYWYSLAYNLREQQQFYNEVLFTRFFKPLKIDFYKPGFDDNYPNQLKEKIKNVVPNSIKETIKQIKGTVFSNDVNNLAILNGMIKSRLQNSEGLSSEINNTHANYFLQNLKK